MSQSARAARKRKLAALQQQPEPAPTLQPSQRSQPSARDAAPPMAPDDERCKVLGAIREALLREGNRPSSPRELAAIILRDGLAVLGGQTPYATVSSRISQHFKRCAEASRRPLLGKIPGGTTSSLAPTIQPEASDASTTTTPPRKWRYYLDGVPLPANEAATAGRVDAMSAVTEMQAQLRRKKAAAATSVSEDDTRAMRTRGRRGETSPSSGTESVEVKTNVVKRKRRNGVADVDGAPASPPPSASTDSATGDADDHGNNVGSASDDETGHAADPDPPAKRSRRTNTTKPPRPTTTTVKRTSTRTKAGAPPAAAVPIAAEE
ncbi:uncharacterized protein EV422DRAFT_509197 [Fimicolochytrium jonesii]|uniref:uncharacterized protein n=1 Tax=Fimicolochytrium jonesii TaxID=1396493 RepID=UPI0022FF2D19|nr:uncharacterized protein EV422DRAFT_509197 [Fimicolochytrium jonesii]KAI8817163.1 hypothetical protein EV422DRAFT_509197 [Fimicolochytrium jonesii]